MSQCDSLLDMCLETLIMCYDWMEFACGFTAIVLGVFTAYVIVQHSTREMRVYRWFLLGVECCDLSMVVYLSFLAQPTFLFPTFAAIVRGPLRLFGGDSTYLLLVFHVIVVSMTLHSIGLSFAYRYAVLAPPRIQYYIRNSKALLAYIVFAIILIAPTVIFAAGTHRDVNDVISEVLKERPHWAAAIGNYVIGGIQMHNTWSTGLVVAIMTSNSLVVIGNMLLYYLIVNRLKHLKVEMNPRTYKMHRMFTRILLLQQLLPTVCLSTPGIIITGFLLTGRIADIAVVVSTIPMFVYHPLNSLVTLLICEPYRRAVASMCRRILDRLRITTKKELPQTA